MLVPDFIKIPARFITAADDPAARCYQIWLAHTGIGRTSAGIIHHSASHHLYLPVIIRTAYCDHFPADPRRSHSSRSRTMISCSHHHYQAVIPGSIYPFYQGGIFRHFPSGKGSYRNIYDPYAIFFPVFPDPPKSH